jgi:hypothetical protein
MKFIFVETVDEVLKAALEPEKKARKMVKAKNTNGKKARAGEINVKSDAN